jgi:hypothetical protein
LEKENALMQEREKKKPGVPAGSDKSTGQESYGNFGKFIQALQKKNPLMSQKFRSSRM